MRSTVRPSWHVIVTAALLVALVAAPLAAAPLVAPAQAADQSLVFEALQVLQTHYVDPVNAPKVLNAAVAGLREQLSAAGIPADLPDMPSSFLTESDARQIFLERFATAAAAASGQLTKTQLAYAAIRSMTDSLHDSHTVYLTPVQKAARIQRQSGQAGCTVCCIGCSYLHEHDNVINALLPFGVPVYTEMLQGGQVEVVRTTRPPLLQASIPVVLMVDEGSASAAELLAAAIQENHRGVLVGAKTSGAVEASVMIDLSDGSALSVTTFRLATGHGVRLEGAGVEPDVTTAMTVEDLEAGQDRQLTTAVRLARQAVADPIR